MPTGTGTPLQHCRPAQHSDCPPVQGPKSIEHCGPVLLLLSPPLLLLSPEESEPEPLESDVSDRVLSEPASLVEPVPEPSEPVDAVDASDVIAVLDAVVVELVGVPVIEAEAVAESELELELVSVLEASSPHPSATASPSTIPALRMPITGQHAPHPAVP